MKCIAVAFDIAALLVGIVAAWFWLKASVQRPQSHFAEDKIVLWRWRPTKPSDYVLPTMEAFEKSGELNKVAAILTGAAVLMSTIGNLLGAWPLWPCFSN